jgi:hypothetical protein
VCCHWHVIEWPLPSTSVWLVVYKLIFYESEQNRTRNKSLKSYEFTKKVSWFLSISVYSYWEIAKEVAILSCSTSLSRFLSSKLLYLQYILSEPFMFWYPHWQEWYLIKIKICLLAQLHYYTAAVTLCWKTVKYAVLLFVIEVLELQTHYLQILHLSTCYHKCSRRQCNL